MGRTERRGAARIDRGLLARGRRRRGAELRRGRHAHACACGCASRGAARCSRARARSRNSACCCSRTCAPRRRALRQEKLAAMGRVSAGIAHEIRNPLAAIAQANALLLEDALPDAAAAPGAHGGRQRRAAEAHRRRRDGGGPGHRAGTERDRRHRRGGRGRRRLGAHGEGSTLGPGSVLQLDLPAQPLRVVFDREHLRRVLVNLLDNARRHGSGSPGAVGVRLVGARRRQRAAARGQRRARRSPQEVERYLFEPFFSTRSRGTGLGLYICRELCERYGASIEYRLRPDGTAQPVPRHHAPRAHVGQRTPNQRPHRMSSAPANSLLVVDDEPDLRTLYELTLVREGYDVETAGTVEEAWALLGERSFSAVITDMRLPDGTGLELLQRLEAAGRSEKAIVITAYGSARERGRGAEVRRLRLPDQAGGPAAVPRRGGLGAGPQLRRRRGPARPRAADARRARRAADEPPLAPPAALQRLVGRTREHAAGARDGRQGGAQHGAGAGARRVGHRQGTGGARHPRAVVARRRALHRRELRRHSRARCSRPSSSATARAPSPARPRTARASSRRRRAARCSSTRSATCRCRCRASCCA